MNKKQLIAETRARIRSDAAREVHAALIEPTTQARPVMVAKHPARLLWAGCVVRFITVLGQVGDVVINPDTMRAEFLSQ